LSRYDPEVLDFRVPCSLQKSNFPFLILQKTAEKAGLQQVLWLYGEDHQLTEVGTMNIFIFMKNQKGGERIMDGTRK